MTTYADWAAGDEISALLLKAGQLHMVIKQANQDVVDSTTMVDDSELVIPLEASAVYVATWCLAVGAVDNGGGLEPHINTEFTVPAGATGFKFAQGPRYPGTATSDRTNTTMVTAVHNFTTDRQYGTISLTSAAAAVEHHTYVTSSTAGDVTLRFCLGNNPAGAGDTCRVLAGSFVAYTRVG